MIKIHIIIRKIKRIWVTFKISLSLKIVAFIHTHNIVRQSLFLSELIN
jgi:hypothetical protein